MIGIRGGKADDNQIAAATARYTNCDLCGGSTAMPVCSTYSLYPTCGDSCVEPPLACAKPVDDAIY